MATRLVARWRAPYFLEERYGLADVHGMLSRLILIIQQALKVTSDFRGPPTPSHVVGYELPCFPRAAMISRCATPP